MFSCFGKGKTAEAQDKTVSPALAAGNLSNASAAVAKNETDAFDETAASCDQRVSRGTRMNQSSSVRRPSAVGSPGTSSPSRHPSLESSLVESSATEFWDKMGKSFGTTFEDADNSMCDRLLLGLSRVKNLGSGGFASVFQARWRHVRPIMRHCCMGPLVEFTREGHHLTHGTSLSSQRSMSL